MTSKFEDFEGIAPEFVKAIDWFIVEGAEVNNIYMTEPWSSEVGPLAQAIVNDFEFYVGHPVCGDFRMEPLDDLIHGYDITIVTDCPHGHIVEVAGLAVLGSPLDLEVLEALVRPLKDDPSVDSHSLDVEVSFEEENNVWVTRRLSREDLESANFDSLMRSCIELTRKVAEAVQS